MRTFKIVPGCVFLKHITAVRDANIKYGSGLDIKSLSYYHTYCVCFLSFENGLPLGYAIENANGVNDVLINVFKHPNIAGRVSGDIITHAINNGVKRLDCYATIKNIYEAYGFKTYLTQTFDKILAPANLLGTPDVHFMYLNNQ